MTVSLLTDGKQHNIGAGDDTLISIEGIIGSAFADSLTGSRGADILMGGGGDDTLDGVIGSDLIDGGDGRDTAVLHDFSGHFTWTQAIDGTVTIWNHEGSLYGTSTLRNVEVMQFNDRSVVLSPPNVINGSSGNDNLVATSANDIIDGGAGTDTVEINGASADFSWSKGPGDTWVVKDLRYGSPEGNDTLRNIEQLKFSDKLVVIVAPPSSVVVGSSGNDSLKGTAGNDALDGGDGLDTAVYSGAASDYSWTRAADGTWTVTDLRTGAGDGRDTLKSVEVLRFSDKSVSLPQLVIDSVLRGGGGALATEFSDRIAGATLSLDGAIASVVKTASATTSVASLSYQFFTGKIPTLGGVDYLVSPTSSNGNNLNSAYYAKFDTVNRYINFAVNLGKNGEAKDSFLASYGSLSLFDATKKAYAAIFGGTPTDAKVHAIIDTRVDYLAYYGGDGATGIGTKAAMVGFLLAAAATENVGVLARSNEAWLTDLSDGSAPFAVNILDSAKGYYKADFIFGG